MEQKGALQTGFTKFVIDFLATQRTIIIDGKTRTLGGGAPKPSVLDKCFTRMCNWLQIARHTIKAEFPEFAMVRAFEVFNLESTMGPTVRADHVVKLASIFNVDRFELESQLLDMWQLAHTHRERGVSNHEAWRLAIASTRSSLKSRSLHPHDVLVKVLANHLSWAVGTSAVERNFSLVERFMSDRSMSESLVDDEIQLLTLKGFNTGDREKLCAAARSVWTSTFPKPRDRGPTRRRDYKAQRPDCLDPSSEAGFLRKRRLDTDTNCQSVDVEVAAEPAERTVGLGGWEASHEKEVFFQKAKRQHRLMENLADGTLGPEEYDEDDLQNLQDIKNAESKTRKGYFAKRRRIDSILARPDLPDFQGKMYYTRESLDAPLRRCISNAGLRVTENMFHAHAYIVGNLDDIPADFMWPAVLQGKLIVSKMFMSTNGKQGNLMRYHPACQISRAVYITPRFARDHEHRAVEVMAATHVATPVGGTSWKLVSDIDAFKALIRKANRQQKRSTVAAFVTEDDVQENMFPDLHLQITAGTFVEILGRIDRRHTFTGFVNMCGGS